MFRDDLGDGDSWRTGEREEGRERIGERIRGGLGGNMWSDDCSPRSRVVYCSLDVLDVLDVSAR